MYKMGRAIFHIMIFIAMFATLSSHSFAKEKSYLPLNYDDQNGVRRTDFNNLAKIIELADSLEKDTSSCVNAELALELKLATALFYNQQKYEIQGSIKYRSDPTFFIKPILYVSDFNLNRKFRNERVAFFTFLADKELKSKSDGGKTKYGVPESLRKFFKFYFYCYYDSYDWNNLLEVYLKGKPLPKKYELLQESADMGSFLAQFELARLYALGEIKPQNYAKSFELLDLCYKKSAREEFEFFDKFYDEKDYFFHDLYSVAKSKYACLLNNLGIFYFRGIGGVSSSEKMAFEFFQKASQILHNPEIFANLAFCYCNGVGCDKNEAKARQVLEENLLNFPSEKIDELLKIKEPKFIWEELGKL